MSTIIIFLLSIHSAFANVYIEGTTLGNTYCSFSITDEGNVRFSWENVKHEVESMAFTPKDYSEGIGFQEYKGASGFHTGKIKIFFDEHFVIYQALLGSGLFAPEYHTVCNPRES